MVASVSDFIQTGINHGGQRPNRFKVTFTFPPSVGGDTRKLALLTQGAQVPGMTVGETIVPYMGRSVTLAGDITLNSWTTTVTMDDMEQFNVFKRWQNAILGTNSNVGDPAPSNYMGGALVELLDRNDTPVEQIEVGYIWPSVVSDIELNHANNNIVMTSTITFSINDIKSSADK